MTMDNTFRKLAKGQYHRDGEIEIDEDAKVSLSSEDGKVRGAYVAAWVWVDAPEVAPNPSPEAPAKGPVDRLRYIDLRRDEVGEERHTDGEFTERFSGCKNLLDALDEIREINSRGFVSYIFVDPFAEEIHGEEVLRVYWDRDEASNDLDNSYGDI